MKAKGLKANTHLMCNRCGHDGPSHAFSQDEDDVIRCPKCDSKNIAKLRKPYPEPVKGRGRRGRRPAKKK